MFACATVLTTIVVLLAFVGQVQSQNFDNNPNAVIANQNIPGGIIITGASNAVITLGPNLVTPTIQFQSVATASNITLIGCTVSGEITFAGMNGGTRLIVQDSYLSSRISITSADGVSLVRFSGNVFDIPTASSVDTAIELGTTTSDVVEITDNQITVSTTTLTTGVSCVQLQSSAITGVDFIFTNNTCALTAPNAVGLWVQSAMTFTGTSTIADNTITTTGSASAYCVRVDDFRQSSTLFNISGNVFTGSGGGEVFGLVIASTIGIITLPALTVSGNTITTTSNGPTGSASGLQINFVLRPGTTALILKNTITPTANRDTTAIVLGGGFANSAAIDIIGNTATVTNSALGTGRPGILSVTQSSSTATNVSVVLSTNLFTLSGSYGPGFFGIAAASGFTVAGIWLLDTNTMTRALGSSLLFAPSLDLNGGTNAHLAIRCNTLNGGPLVLADATSSVTNAGSYVPEVIACGTCVWALQCNTAMTSDVVVNGSLCLCRCIAEPDQLDPLPRSTQCIAFATTTTTVTAPTTTTPAPGSNNLVASPLSGGAIAGIVIGIIAFLVLLILLIWYCCCRDTTNKEDDKEHANNGNGGTKSNGNKTTNDPHVTA